MISLASCRSEPSKVPREGEKFKNNKENPLIIRLKAKTFLFFFLFLPADRKLTEARKKDWEVYDYFWHRYPLETEPIVVLVTTIYPAAEKYLRVYVFQH